MNEMLMETIDNHEVIYTDVSEVVLCVCIHTIVFQSPAHLQQKSISEALFTWNITICLVIWDRTVILLKKS
jgi:hypothetical protein